VGRLHKTGRYTTIFCENQKIDQSGSAGLLKTVWLKFKFFKTMSTKICKKHTSFMNFGKAWSGEGWRTSRAHWRKTLAGFGWWLETETFSSGTTVPVCY
jgi:hypothetical protein